MKCKLFHVDAFTSEVFKGNSACVVVLPEQISNEKMLKIAAENGVAETAFILPKNDFRELGLRWFTPDIEMDLCGHATLAAGYVMFNFYREDVYGEEVKFNTKEGEIIVREDGRRYCLDFPIRKGRKAELPDNIYNSLSIKPLEVYLARDYHLVYDSWEDVKNLKVNREEFDRVNLGTGGVVVSAKGEDCDFVSRFFTPQATILEDPVTGSAHCTLVPYWGEILGKRKLFAKQISERGGELYCELTQKNVLISGDVICYLQGEILI